MLIFSLCFGVTILIAGGIGYFLCNVLSCPVKYNNWIRVKTGFYSDFVGQVKKANFFKYYVKLYGKEVNNSMIEKLDYSGWAWWWNLEVIDKPASLVKDDFYKQIVGDEDDSTLVSVISAYPSSSCNNISNTVSAISTYLSVTDEEEDNGCLTS